MTMKVVPIPPVGSVEFDSEPLGECIKCGRDALSGWASRSAMYVSSNCSYCGYRNATGDEAKKILGAADSRNGPSGPVAKITGPGPACMACFVRPASCPEHRPRPTPVTPAERLNAALGTKPFQKRMRYRIEPSYTSMLLPPPELKIELRPGWDTVAAATRFPTGRSDAITSPDCVRGDGVRARHLNRVYSSKTRETLEVWQIVHPLFGTIDGEIYASAEVAMKYADQHLPYQAEDTATLRAQARRKAIRDLAGG